jgi:hypothetical protein
MRSFWEGKSLEWKFAQRLASLFIATGDDVCPPYVKAALDYMKAKLA